MSSVHIPAHVLLPLFPALVAALSCGGPSDSEADASGATTGPTAGSEDDAEDHAEDSATTPGDDTSAGGGADTVGGEDSEDTSGDTSDTAASATATGGDVPPTTDVRNYIFGHSLILHSDAANVPIWMQALAEHEGYTYAMSGQYGFADTHATELPPDPQWGIQGVASPWDADTGESFSDIDFNTVLLTEANFRQYYPPTESDPDGFLPESTVDSTTAVFDWVADAEPGVRYVLYENWPDMGGYTDADFRASFPTADEMSTYHAYTSGEFHAWWAAYQDAMLAARPELNVRMLPVGPILAQLQTTVLADVPVEALYEDSAPHGQPTLYFLAGLVTYMGIYAAPAPADYVVPESVHPLVRELYPEIVDVIWSELQAFEDADGDSRVF